MVHILPMLQNISKTLIYIRIVCVNKNSLYSIVTVTIYCMVSFYWHVYMYMYTVHVHVYHVIWNSYAICKVANQTHDLVTENYNNVVNHTIWYLLTWNTCTCIWELINSVYVSVN